MPVGNRVNLYNKLVEQGLYTKSQKEFDEQSNMV